jgi:hypothetical protein
MGPRNRLQGFTETSISHSVISYIFNGLWQEIYLNPSIAMLNYNIVSLNVEYRNFIYILYCHSPFRSSFCICYNFYYEYQPLVRLYCDVQEFPNSSHRMYIVHLYNSCRYCRNGIHTKIAKNLFDVYLDMEIPRIKIHRFLYPYPRV